MLKSCRLILRFRFAALAFLLLCTLPAVADVVSQYDDGLRRQAAGDFYGAIEIFRGVLNENPSYGDAWKSFAECAYAVSEYDLSLSCATRALEFKKNSPELHNLRAFALIGLVRLDEARAEFSSVLVSYPNDVQARFGLAELDVAEGKTAAASELYRDALVRQPENRKALLSLAVVCGETGNFDAAETFINQALKYHGGRPDVLYFAGWLAVKQEKYTIAESRLRSALATNPSFEDAAALLISLLYSRGRYREAAEWCDTMIANNRNAASAWFVKARALEKNDNTDEALTVYLSALNQFPHDSILRTAFEQLVQRTVPLEDSRRSSWAVYHVQQAAHFESEFYSDQALFEYRRALKIDPYNAVTRKKYASLILKKGWPVRYLEQLSFASAQGLSTTDVSDNIESYTSLLQDKLNRTWNVDFVTIDAAHTSIGIYCTAAAVNVMHPGAEQITVQLLGDVLAHSGRFMVSVAESPVTSFTEAFRKARRAGQDYFVLTRFEENSEDVKITLDIYSGRTGAIVDSISSFRTGSDRYYSAVRRSVRSFNALMPFRGVLLKRNGKQALIDRGSVDGVEKDMQFTLVKKDTLSTADEGLGFRYKKSDITGTFTVTAVNEDLAEGTVKNEGFYDKIAVGDEVIFIPVASDTAGTPPNVPEEQEQPQQKNVIVQTIPDDVRTPALLRLLRSIGRE